MNIAKQSNKQFWIFNIIGWFVYLLFGGIFFSLMQGAFILNTFYMQVFSFVLMVVSCYYLRQLIKTKGLLNQIASLKTLILLLVVTFLMALIAQIFVSLLMMFVLHIMTWEQYSFTVLAITTVQVWVSIVGWTLVYFIIKHRQKSRTQEIEKWQLQTALKEAELQVLKSQLNPHFIFNCLNNIRALAIDDGVRTRQMLTHLSEILKFTFQFNQQKLVSLEQEVSYVRNYLELESIQLDERLNSDITIQTGLGSWQIPPMSIQLLVENAIKHGIMQLENGGNILINIYGDNKKLNIEVINDGQLQDNGKNQGIGLNNLQKRLSLLVSESSTLTIKQLNHNQVQAQLVLLNE